MTKRNKMFISLMLIAAMISLSITSAFAKDKKAPPPAYFDLPVSIDTVKVGISFGDSVQRAVTVQDGSVEGLSVGYFDFSRVFHSFGELSNFSLTMHPDVGYTYMVDEEEEQETVGAWHILMDTVFDDLASASATAEKYYGGFPAYIDGQFRALAGAFETSDDAADSIAERELDAECYSGGDDSILCTSSEEHTLVFLTDKKLALRSSSKDPSGLWYAGNLYYGNLEILCRDGSLSVVSFVPLEDYVKCVLPYEMVASWPMEALKAQGACARTYVTHYINAYADMGFDLRNDTYSQVYKGQTGTVAASDEAAEATSGQYVRYRGAPCKIYYMSSDGGATDSSANVFSQRRAYLSGVTDHNEDELDFYNKTWSAVLLEETVLRRLGYSDYVLSDVADIQAEKSFNGIVCKLTITDSEGKTVTLYGDDCFLVLSLHSLNFDVYSEEEGLWTFDGKGWGHNCGMSQWGAYGMAKNSKASCHDIIDFYFSGAYLR